MEDKYHALITDTDTVTTSIVYFGGRKTVEDFGRGGPVSLTKIEQAIDNAAEQIVWQKIEIESWEERLTNLLQRSAG